MRSTRAELAMAQWMFHGLLDNPGPGEFEGAKNEFVRLFYLKKFQGVQNIQEVTTTVRSTVQAPDFSPIILARF